MLFVEPPTKAEYVTVTKDGRHHVGSMKPLSVPGRTMTCCAARDATARVRCRRAVSRRISRADVALVLSARGVALTTPTVRTCRTSPCRYSAPIKLPDTAFRDISWIIVIIHEILPHIASDESMWCPALAEVAVD